MASGLTVGNGVEEDLSQPVVEIETNAGAEKPGLALVESAGFASVLEAAAGDAKELISSRRSVIWSANSFQSMPSPSLSSSYVLVFERVDYRSS